VLKNHSKTTQKPATFMKKPSKSMKKSQKIPHFLPVFYGSTISRMRFHPHNPPFPSKSTKKNRQKPIFQFPLFFIFFNQQHFIQQSESLNY